MQDASRLAESIAALLTARRETLAVAESSAGGLINAALVAVPGASAWYVGGAIIYTATGRERLLGITREDMQGVRSASEAFAQLLARRMRERLGTAWALAETGASGPSGNRYGDAPGHACIAVSGPSEAVVTLETGRSERAQNMRDFTHEALVLLEGCLRSA